MFAYQQYFLHKILANEKRCFMDLQKDIPCLISKHSYLQCFLNIYLNVERQTPIYFLNQSMRFVHVLQLHKLKQTRQLICLIQLL